MATQPALTPADRAPPAPVGYARRRRHRAPRRQRRVHRADVGAPRRPRPDRHPRRRVHRGRPDHGPPRHVSRAHPARAHGPQPVARRGLRDGPPGVGPPVARVRDGVADRRPRRAHDDRLRAGRRHRRGRRVRQAADHVPVRAVGDGRLRPVRDGRRQLDARRPSPAVVRDLVRAPPLRLPRDRPRVPAPAVHRGGLHPRPARGDLLDLAVRPDRRARADVPRRRARADLGAPSPARRRRGGRGARRRLAVPRGPRPRSPRGPLGPVLHAPLPDPRRLVARPSVLDLVGARTGAGSGSRSRSSATTARGSGISRSGPGSSSRDRTAS